MMPKTRELKENSILDLPPPLRFIERKSIFKNARFKDKVGTGIIFPYPTYFDIIMRTVRRP
jgi:hypothetical protein